MIAIIDYGVGNLFSLASSLKSLGLETEVTRDAAAIRAADHIIRTETDYWAIVQYIDENPLKWFFDPLYQEGTP